MKVSKAIELLEGFLLPNADHQYQDLDDAVSLAIEALKRHRNRDYLTYNQVHEILPGETPEEDVK